MERLLRKFSIRLLITTLLCNAAQGGVIKDIFQKITNTNNQTDDTVKQSAPICGSGAFSTPDEASLSPEIIFISNRSTKIESVNSNTNNDHDYEHHRRATSGRDGEGVNEVANEFRFHTENVTLEELERHGFNRDGPVSFLMHGFTSGYPLQAWISAIVEAYTIDRETNGRQVSHGSGYYDNNQRHEQGSNPDGDLYNRDTESQSRRNNRDYADNREPKRIGGGVRLKHNLFIINWNYAARGIVYPRAVANIPIVASYVTRFINDKLIDEARVNPKRIQLIGHSLGAHLAGFIGKNTKSKLGRIYGLDPAGPCFGALSGPLYPSSKRLAPSDADEVISIHTNSALLGIDKPLGKYSVFVEGGEVQPGCKGGGILKSIGTLTWDGGDFNTVACSHSRAPNLLTYRHNQRDSEDDCQMVAYGCKDWDSFQAGHCGICRSSAVPDASSNQDRGRDEHSPLEPVECLRIGLDWQYPGSKQQSGQGSHSSSSNYHHDNEGDYHNPNQHSSGYNREPLNNSHENQYNRRTTSRPYSSSESYNSREEHNSKGDEYNQGRDYDQSNRRNNNSNEFPGRRPNYSSSSSYNDRQKRDDERQRSNSSTERSNSERRSDDSVEARSLFMKTGDTQPYCSFHYQVVLELNEPFPNKKRPPMSIILQDSEPDSGYGGGQRERQPRGEQNSLSNDEFGNKFNDTIYTHLLLSSKKLKRVDHGTLIFSDGLPDGHHLLRVLHVNYMSHSEPQVRQRLSSRLCPVRTGVDRGREAGNRFYFKPCDRESSSDSASSLSYGQQHNSHGQSYGQSNSNYNSGGQYNSNGHSQD